MQRCQQLGMVQQKSPARAQSDQLPGDYFRQMWWRCSCLASALCLLEMNSWGQLWRGALTMSNLSLCQQVKGWARRLMNYRCRVTRRARKQVSRSYWGTRWQRRAANSRVSPVTQKQSTHKSASVRSDYLRGSGPGLKVCSLLSQVWIYSLKEKSKQAEKCQSRSMAARRKSDLPKSSEASSFKCSFSVLSGPGQGVEVGQSLFIF